MSFRENKGMWLGIAAALLVIVAIIWLILSGGPLTLVVLFPDIGELKREDPVIWRGYAVGKVVKVEPLVDNQIGVTIQLREDYAAKVTHGTRFTLKRAPLFGLVGGNAIEIETPSEMGRRFADGERVQGISPPKPTLVEEGKQYARDYWRQIQSQAAQLVEEYRQSPYRKEVEDALSQIRTLAEQGAGQAQEGLEQFRKDHQKELDAAMKRLEQARDWIRKKGDEPAARKVEEEIKRLKK